MVVYGHTPVPEPQWLNNTICLDTGCVFGGKLTALRYPEKQLVSIAAARVYYQPQRPLTPLEADPQAVVAPVTILTSLMDMSIGVLIAFRRTCTAGLIAGMVASLGYMVGAAILTPDLWIEPLGALVKTGPAIVLMLVALLTLDNR